MAMQVSLGFSPCPNDTFMFDAWVNSRLSTSAIKLKTTIADVEQLNELALSGALDITKISLNAYASVAKEYEILTAGSALGFGCGPLLVSKRAYKLDDINELKIAIPGKLTTANLLLSIFAPAVVDKTAVLFSDIEKEVLAENYDAGLLIHEGRFTYRKKGLHKIADMGELWEHYTHGPLPLGCIVIKKSFPENFKKEVNECIAQSVRFAFENPEASAAFVKEHAQELSEQVVRDHIRLYVNAYSENLGEQGKSAIRLLLSEGFKHGLMKEVLPEFTGEKLNVVTQ